jgi:serine/threonine-protein kinase TTK/MPS1
VFALKRVRVAPGDDRALESFSNEITLLRRLTGHPSIIQLVDWAVDREAGLVQLLMEIGEVDLNKLMEQSAAEEGGLSLNFIRYIWEQMLRAVLCVHEVRSLSLRVSREAKGKDS